MSIFDLDNQPFDEEGLTRHIARALAVRPPDNRLQDLFYNAIRRTFRPVLLDTHNIPDQPCLFIGNHSLFALDGMVLVPMMLKEEGRFLRGLGDRFLFNPATEKTVVEQGGVLGHPDVCAALMDAGEDLMVFPGGAHEATKTSAQKYTLQWRARYGFARLAAQHGYTIMPFAMVGPDDFYRHLMEGEDLPDSALGALFKRLGLLTEDTRTDMLPPIPMGVMGTLLPRPQRCFVKFGQALDLTRRKGKNTSQKQLDVIRTQVARQIEEMIAELLLLREQKRGEDGLLRRILNR